MNPVVATQSISIPRENKNAIQENNEPLLSISKAIQPVVDIRLDLRRILEKEYLFALPSSLATHRAQHLLLTSKEKDPPRGNMAWLRIYPPDEEMRLHYEIADPEANDLIKCNRVFCKIMQFPNRMACLDALAAPSFNGKKAVSLVWNLMAMASIADMILVDGSTILGCCDDGALSSLHLVEVFLKGKSWYVIQGASSKISKTALKTLFEEEIFGSYAKAITKGEIEDPRISVTLDYDRFSKRMLAIQIPEFETSIEAYRKACRFLHNLSLAPLANCLSQLVAQYPLLQSLQEILRQAKQVHVHLPSSSAPTRREGQDAFFLGEGNSLQPLAESREKADCPSQPVGAREIGGEHVPKQESTMGAFFQEILDKDRENHQADTHELLHAYRDCFVSNKDSVFFQYIVDVLTQNQVSNRSCALAFLVLNHFCNRLQHVQVDTKEVMKIVQLLLKSPEAALKYAEKYENLADKDSTRFLQYLEEESGQDSPREKVFNHSTHKNREKWVQYMMETGISNEFLAAQTAIQYLANIPFSSFEKMCPELVQNVGTRCVSSCDTLSILLQTLESDDPALEKIFLELLSGSIKYLSLLSIPLFDAYFSGQREEESIYELLMIAKYLCEKKNFFALVWPQID